MENDKPLGKEEIKRIERIKKTIKTICLVTWHKILGGYWEGDMVIHKNRIRIVEARKGHWPNRKYDLRG